MYTIPRGKKKKLEIRNSVEFGPGLNKIKI